MLNRPDDDQRRVRPVIIEANFDAVERELARNLEQLRDRANRRRRIPLVIDTIGLEIEGVFESQGEVNDAILSSRQGKMLSTMYTITRDASTEIQVVPIKLPRSHTLFVNYNTTLARKYLPAMNRSTIGFEIVSKPLMKDDMRFFVDNITEILNKKGAFTSERCATHVHIGVSNSLRIIKTAFAFALYFEDLFYALAGMGNKFRGYTNNSAYARPLSQGIYLPYNRGHWVKIPNITKALDARDVYEFYAAFHVDAGEPLMKHHPSRYVSINLYSIIEKGTLEFRVANSTFNPAYLNAFIELCQASAEFISNSNYSSMRNLGVCDTTQYKTPDFYREKLNFLVRLMMENGNTYNVSDESRMILEEIIDTTPPFVIGNANNVLTHVRDFQATEHLVLLGKLEITSKRPIKAGNIDIHNIGEYDVPIV